MSFLKGCALVVVGSVIAVGAFVWYADLLPTGQSAEEVAAENKRRTERADQLAQRAQERTAAFPASKARVLADVRGKLARKDLKGARAALAAWDGVADADLEPLRTKLAAAQQAETLREGRKAIGDAMRTKFLDAGLDIKVRVSGAQNERIRFEYILFGDVWSHKFRTEGMIDTLAAAGFKRVEMSDGRDWGVYWTF